MIRRLGRKDRPSSSPPLNLGIPEFLAGSPSQRYPCLSMFAYYDSDADIAWFPTGESDDVVSERVPGGLRDYDRTSHKLVAIEVWDASTRLPASILEALPAPGTAHRAAA